jgi:hypothetical protein
LAAAKWQSGADPAQNAATLIGLLVLPTTTYRGSALLATALLTLLLAALLATAATKWQTSTDAA